MKAILVGATGRMGQAIICLSKNEDLDIVAGVGLCSECESIFDVACDADVIMDFSTPALIDDIIAYASKNKIPTFIGTTGHNDEQREKIQKLGEIIPVCLASNTSVGINTLFAEVANMAKKLDDWDVEIFEKHHHNKKDSPSGTALSLAHTIIQERPELEIVTDRTNHNYPRKENELGISSIRAGSIVGEHTVYFVKNDEIVEVTHRALSRDIFAQGAITMAKKLAKKPIGFYRSEELV